MITPKKYAYGPDKPGFVGYYLAAEVDELLVDILEWAMTVKDYGAAKVVNTIKKTLRQS